jgi:antitoxin ChpS
MDARFVGREQGLYPMREPTRTTVKCQDPGDGSGDVIIDLPSHLLESMNLNLGDSLSIELLNLAIVLRPVRNADAPS